MTTPRLGAPELSTSQAGKEETVNEAVRHIEAGAGHFIFIDRELDTPPGAPSDGDCYLVGSSPTGVWASNADDIAFRVNTAWAFITPIEGFTAWVNDENVFIGYDGAAWNTLSSPSGTYLPLTGGTLSGDLSVPDEAYDATSWNGNAEVPTKNAVRDKIESLSSGASETTAAEFRAGTQAGEYISPDIAFDAAATVALSESGGNVAVDMSSGFNFTLAMTGNWTLSSPSNEKVGQAGFIRIAQDGTGSRTLAYGAEWKFAGGTDPTLSTAAGSVDVLFYQVIASGEIYANLVKAIA